MSNANAPANPTHYMEFTNAHGGTDELYSNNQGLTKREAFAMAAMQGMTSHPEFYGGSTEWANNLASYSVKMADALLKELDK